MTRYGRGIGNNATEWEETLHEEERVCEKLYGYDVKSQKETAIDIKQDTARRTNRCTSRIVLEQASATRVPGKRALCRQRKGSSDFVGLSRDDAQKRQHLVCNFGTIVGWHQRQERYRAHLQ